jgi:hypothetical protein
MRVKKGAAPKGRPKVSAWQMQTGQQIAVLPQPGSEFLVLRQVPGLHRANCGQDSRISTMDLVPSLPPKPLLALPGVTQALVVMCCMGVPARLQATWMAAER